MLTLKEITFKDFENDIYKYYVEAFPRNECQSKKSLKKLNKENIIKFVKIIEEEEVVGFIIYVTIKDNPYVWLDYFAIRKEYQNKKYGSKAIQIFKGFFTEYDGIYIEFEKEGLGADKKENEIRKKRINFWKKVGFELLNIDMKLFSVAYSSAVLRLNNNNLANDKIIEYGFRLYEAVMGKRECQKNCFIMDSTNNKN